MRERIAFRVGLRKMPMLNAIWCGLQIRAWRERWTKRTGHPLYHGERAKSSRWPSSKYIKLPKTAIAGSSYRMRLKVPSLAETGKVSCRSRRPPPLILGGVRSSPTNPARRQSGSYPLMFQNTWRSPSCALLPREDARCYANSMGWTDSISASLWAVPGHRAGGTCRDGNRRRR